MLLLEWALLSGMSFVLTLTWLFLSPDHGVLVSAGLSTVGWSAAALTAPALQVVSNGQLLDAGSPTLSFVALAFASLSALATLGYATGNYPPDQSRERRLTDPDSEP